MFKERQLKRVRERDTEEEEQKNSENKSEQFHIMPSDILEK